jgi:hypothetical protein
MIVRIFAVVLGVLHTGNGLYMLIAPHRWFLADASYTGPFNRHFVLDVGVAFLAAGLAFLVLAWDRRAALLALGASGFLVGHALVHLVALRHGAGAAIDLGAIVLPAALGVAVAWPCRSPADA